MTTFKTQRFGEVVIAEDGAYVSHVAAADGRTRTPSLFIGAGLDQARLDLAASRLDGIAGLDTRARDAISADLDRDADGVVASFVAFHLEELDVDARRTIFGDAEVPSHRSTLARLDLVGVAIHAAPSGFSLVLDYSFDRRRTDALLAVSYDENGRLVRVSHES
jgi:Protein of unknown function (DUF2004)